MVSQGEDGRHRWAPFRIHLIDQYVALGLYGPWRGATNLRRQ